MAQPPVASTQEVSYPEEARGWRVTHRGTGGAAPASLLPRVEGVPSLVPRRPPPGARPFSKAA